MGGCAVQVVDVVDVVTQLTPVTVNRSITVNKEMDLMQRPKAVVAPRARRWLIEMQGPGQCVGL
jgi:hypothetical protein